jgi:hypothetical protein
MAHRNRWFTGLPIKNGPYFHGEVLVTRWYIIPWLNTKFSQQQREKKTRAHAPFLDSDPNIGIPTMMISIMNHWISGYSFVRRSHIISYHISIRPNHTGGFIAPFFCCHPSFAIVTRVYQRDHFKPGIAIPLDGYCWLPSGKLT